VSETLAIAEAAARAAGAQLLAAYGGEHVAIHSKSTPTDMVSEADLAAERLIRDILREHAPEDGIVGEEGEDTPSASGRHWVVDPLDGTTNFVHDVPAYCVSIGLWWHGEAVVGVIYDPRMKEMFTAAKGCGAYLNGEPMKVSTAPKLHDALLSTGFPAKFEAQARNFEAWKKLSSEAQALRRSGSTALNLAYVACGRFDGYWAYDNWAWDVTGGACLITEAGGALSNVDGGPFDPFRMDLIATNGKIQRELLDALTAAEGK
jgi:myo-inositol-1(or 4)-monophosphatase